MADDIQMARPGDRAIDSLEALQATGTCTAEDVELYDFRALCSLIGFEEVWAFGRKWAERD